MGADSLRTSAVPRLHVVTDDRVVASVGFAAVAGELLRRGRSDVALHLRAPAAGGGALHSLATQLEPVARGTGAMLVVNDRVDVALTVPGCDVQLGGRSLPLPVARPLVPPTVRIGVSVHDAEGAARAAAEGADWIVFGSVYATPTHPGVAGSGARALDDALGGAQGVPVLAIGGVTPARVGEVRAAGAWGVAVIRGIWGADDPEVALSAYLSALTAVEGPSAAEGSA